MSKKTKKVDPIAFAKNVAKSAFLVEALTTPKIIKGVEGAQNMILKNLHADMTEKLFVKGVALSELPENEVKYLEMVFAKFYSNNARVNTREYKKYAEEFHKKAGV